MVIVPLGHVENGRDKGKTRDVLREKQGQPKNKRDILYVQYGPAGTREMLRSYGE